jgi:hypothetical protein
LDFPNHLENHPEEGFKSLFASLENAIAIDFTATSIGRERKRVSGLRQ